MAEQHIVSVTNKTIIAVADPHLESMPDDVAQMAAFVGTLDPMAHVIVILGDLFHTWTASRPYHSNRQKRLMEALANFRTRGGAVYFTVGNRDLFFKDRVAGPGDNGLPFDVVSRDYISLDTENGVVMIHHGDTVNCDDKAYLRWRRFIRSGLTETLFSLIPASQGKKIIASLEKKIKRTNQAFRIHFPQDNWSRFVRDHEAQHAPGLLLVGHFHPEQPIVTRHGETTGIVVPSWHPYQAYLEIDARLNYEVKRFNG